MKKQLPNLFVPISKKELDSFAKPVRETLAKNSNPKRTFSANDLWKIQRNKKRVSIRKFFV